MAIQRPASANSSVAGSSVGGGSEYAKSDAGRSEAGGVGDIHEDQELLPKKATVEDAIFGVLYTLSKEKPISSFRTAIFKLVLDFAQLVVFYVDPAFGWKFKAENLYDVLYNFQLQNPLKDFGFTAWFVVFCLLVVVLCGSVGLCAYVAHNFKTGRFPHVWPIKLLRFFVAIFFTLFYVSTLGVFIMTFDCDYSAGAAEAVNRKFPTRACLKGVMLPASVVGVLLSVTFTTVAFFMEQAESDQNPLFRDPLGTPTSAVNVRNMLGKTAISILWVIFVDTSKGFLGLVMFGITSFLFYDVVRNMPYYYQLINYVKSGLYSLLAWFSLLNMLMVYREGQVENDVMIFYLGTPAALAAGLFSMYVRTRRIKRVQTLFLTRAREALANAGEDVKVESILPDIDHEFWDPIEVELVSRLIRAKLKYQTRRRSRKVQLAKEEEAVLNMAAQAALLVGLEQFPEESYLQILYGNFLIAILKDSALGYSYLERARGQKVTFEERLMIFTKDRERTQQLGDDSGAAKMDLVRYVEFQNSFGLIKKTHQLALRSTQRFWRLLLHTDVSFGSLSKAFKDMDMAESKGDRTYKVMIERYPKSSKLLRSYGRFLEDVRNDPWRAQRYFTEAERIDDEASYEVGSVLGDSDADADDLPTDMSNVDDKKYAVVVIKPNGVIRIANAKIEKLFGYNSGDLVGKNVSMLMPQPYSQQHNGYLKRYMATGKATIMGSKQKLQGRHKKGHVFPINLLVSKVPGGTSANDVNFMGIVTARKDDEGVGLISMNKNGVMNAFNVACEGFFGISSSKAPGKPFKKLLDKASVKPFEEAMGLAMAKVGDSIERQLQAIRENGNTFPITVTLVADASGGIEAKIHSLDDVMGMITIDEVGQIKNANEYVAQMFGHSMTALTSMNVAELMPRPYSTFHPSYLKRYKSTKKSNIVGDVLGRNVDGLHKSGHTFPINLQVYTIENTDGSDEVLYSGRITLPKSSADDGRMARCTVRDDGSILQMAEHFLALYGVKPDTFTGRNLQGDLVTEVDDDQGGLLAAVSALEPVEAKRPVKQSSILSFGRQSSVSSTVGGGAGIGSRRSNLALDAEQGGGLVHAGGYSARGVLHFGGTPMLVFITTEATMVPRTLALQMWAGHLMEGVIEITKGGVISRATFGIQILFGYHEDDLHGNNVSMLMPHSVAKHHDMFLQRYQEGERRNLIGVRRIVDGKHRDGTSLRLALEVCDTDTSREVSVWRGEKAAFTARIVLSNEPASATPPEVNASDDDARGGTGGAGGCAFAHLDRTNQTTAGDAAAAAACTAAPTGTSSSGAPAAQDLHLGAMHHQAAFNETHLATLDEGDEELAEPRRVDAHSEHERVSPPDASAPVDEDDDERGVSAPDHVAGAGPVTESFGGRVRSTTTYDAVSPPLPPPPSCPSRARASSASGGGCPVMVRLILSVPNDAVPYYYY